MATRTDVTFPSGDSECAAWFYEPDGAGQTPLPVVVMAHGLGAVREMRLDAWAERFAQAGYAVLVFDYRHFGASGGEPRQLLSVRRQREDWRAAIAYARSRDDLDPRKVAIWGSSFGGGHVIATAAEIPVAAAIAQCPFTDGLSSTLAIPPLTAVKVVGRALRDVVAARLGRPPVTVPLAGEPGSTALMSAPDVVPGYLGIVPEGSSFRNEVAARVAFDILRARPGAQAPRVTCPLHVTICDEDTVAPARRTAKLVAKAPLGEVSHQACGHFDIYDGEGFERVVTDQLDFLKRHVPVG
jgi:pimeloyl-ACP methyl ester carboxylesterase